MAAASSAAIGRELHAVVDRHRERNLASCPSASGFPEVSPELSDATTVDASRQAVPTIRPIAGGRFVAGFFLGSLFLFRCVNVVAAVALVGVVAASPALVNLDDLERNVPLQTGAPAGVF